MTTVREWKPGDVARVNGSIAVRTDDNMSWWTTSGRLSDPNVAYTRPLVVIDPEDREQVERLAKCYREVHGEAELTDEPWSVPGLRMQAALREFANPTPPKPEEPTGLGAVVEDANGLLWIRGKPSSHLVWFDPTSDFDNRHWGQINAVKVLSDGIPA